MRTKTAPEGKDTPLRAPMEQYLIEINETPLLSDEEEQALAVRIKDGDEDALDKLIRANLRLVVSIAKCWTGKGLALEDLIEEGNVGLMDAAKKFRAKRGAKMSTFATKPIVWAIQRAIANHGKTIRAPAYTNELLRDVRNETGRLMAEKGQEPSLDEVTASLGLPKKKLAIIKRAKTVNLPMQSDSQSADADFALDNMTTDYRTEEPEREMIKAELIRKLRMVMQGLDPRETLVIQMRFGLDNEEPKTLKEIGEHLGLTRERVRQIESETLELLRDCMEYRTSSIAS